MKIALVIERLDASKGGRETSTAQIAAELAHRGHDVSIICQSGSLPATPDLVEPIKLIQIGSKGSTRTARLRNFAQAVQQQVSDGKWDIVHGVLPVPGINVYQPRSGTIPGQREASLRRRGPIGRLLVRLAEPWNHMRMLMGRMERRLVEDSSVLCMAVSEMVAKEFIDHYSRRDKVQVIYNGVDVPPADSDQRQQNRQEIRFRMGLGQNDVLFAIIAHNFELKGVQQAIRAFANWYHSDNRSVKSRLLVIGKDMPEGYQRLAGMQDVGNVVDFIPATHDVFRWLAAADVNVLLSWYDPCSRVVLEAARWGIPSITTVFNGAAEALAGGGAIAVSSPADISAITKAMATLADPQQRAAAGEACLKASEQLSTQRHVTELEEAYRRHLER